jgi:DNA-binding transcriptional LysR family regulator
MVGWNLLLAGAGLGFAQLILAEQEKALERLDFDLVPPMPVWLVMHEEVRSNARIRRVADFLAQAISKLLRTGEEMFCGGKTARPLPLL